MKNNLIISITMLLLIAGNKCYSQDPQFSQFYAAPLYLNPAFTGNTEKGRFIGNYRHQWPSIPGAFVSYAFSYDYNFFDLNSGLGLLVMHDKAGSGGLKYTSVGGAYSYNVFLSRDKIIRPGMRISYTFRDLDVARLTFGDQLVTNSSVTSSNSAFADQSVSYPDLSSGIVFYSKNEYWIGMAADHINTPNQSLLINGETKLPVKFSVHGGYNFPLKENIKSKEVTILTLAANYKAQGKWDQLDVGSYIDYEPLVVGVWYRGIPLFKAYEKGYQNNDAVILLVGYEVEKFSIGYSYDLTISRLITDTGGSHEISIVYKYPVPKTKRKKVLIPCAKF